jgi:hypothetical protein
MKIRLSLIGLLFALLLSGCVPTRYSWSPDGRWMTVISDDALHIADADGNLLPGALPAVNMAAWFPDSNRIAVCRQIDIGTWDELVKYVSPADIQTISAISTRLSIFAQNYDWTASNADTWKAFELAWTRQELPTQRAEEDARSDLGTAIALYVRDHASESLRQKIPAPRWKELASLTQPLRSIEVCAIAATGVQPGRQIMTSLKTLHDLRVSPTGAAVLASTEGSAAHDSDLFVIAADASHPAVQLSDRAAWYADFSPEGRDVLFISATARAIKDEQRLGSLNRARVIDGGGAVVDRAPDPVELAGLMFGELNRVRCLKSGRILFTSVDVKLPAAISDMPNGPQLFSINPAGRGTVAAVLTRSALQTIGDEALYFEVSPDGTHLSIPDKAGKVYVVDLASQAITEVQSNPVITSENKPELLTVPQWRSNDELTFVAPGADNRPSVQLYSLSGNSSKTLSAKWPADLIGKKSNAPTFDQPPGGL